MGHIRQDRKDEILDELFDQTLVKVTFQKKPVDPELSSLHLFREDL